jgi:Ran GTPase-activating protein (RanGAP) involved in mRNA processing and transport
MTPHRFFMDPSPRLPDRDLDAITDTGKYIETIASRLSQDLAAQAAGAPVSRTALSLNTQSTREILTDPVANQIALRLFPPAEGKPNESSYQRYRDLVRSLRNRAINEQQSRPKPLSCALPAHHAALQAAAAALSPSPLVKGRPVSPVVAHPAAMPVEIAPAAELEPFFRFLADPGAFAPDELPTPLTFSRGTYFPDHRMDLCKQVVGPTAIEDLCEAVERGHEIPEEREEAATPLTFTRGTYFPDQRMDLCKQVVGPDHIGRLCEAVEAQNHGHVEQRHRVRHFLLGNNIACDGASTAGAHAMARLMANPAIDIETWYLAGNCIGPADMDILASALGSNRQAQALWLKRNPLGVEGGAHLGRMLGQNDTLELLDLHNTGLFDEGVEALCKAITDTGKRLSLQHFYLSANALTERSLGALAPVLTSALPEPCSLVSLYLSINRLGNEALPELVQLISTGALAKLERLDLGSVGLRAPCLAPLVDALLGHCPRLRSLNLGTYLSTRDLGETANELAGDVAAMKRLLQEHGSLELLDISTCGLSVAGGRELVGALGPRQSLHGVGGHALQHSHLERRLLKHPECVLHIDSIYRGRA